MANKKGSAVNIIEGIVIGLLIILIVCMLFLYFSFSKTGAAPNIFGYTIYHTKATNMETEIPANSAVIGKASENGSIKAGDVVICSIKAGDKEKTVITRVTQLVNENGKMSYVVKFDTDPANITYKIPAEKIIANAIWKSPALGSVLSFATSTMGIMLVIIIPSFIIIVFQIIRIVNVKKAEEDAVSLTDLDEIMARDDDLPDPLYTEAASSRSIPTFYTPEPEPERPAEILSVDKNGKAGFAPVSSGNTPLFTYDRLDNPRRNEATAAAKKTNSIIKPPKMPKTDSFMADYAENKNRDLYGNRIKRQEIIPDEDEQTAESSVQTAVSEPENKGSSGFMSNIIPEKLVNAAEMAEAAAAKQDKEPIKTYEPKIVHADKIIRSAPAIPEKAAVPKERIAPPGKKSNSKAISELMSMIDAEESKLHK